jgi:hypothetical protein
MALQDSQEVGKGHYCLVLTCRIHACEGIEVALWQGSTQVTFMRGMSGIQCGSKVWRVGVRGMTAAAVMSQEEYDFRNNGGPQKL